jgi:hypothetical protein
MKLIEMKNNILCFILVSIAFVCWYLLYKAKVSEYDLDFALALLSMLLSTVGTIISIILLRQEKYRLNKNVLVVSVGFLILSSPVTLFLFIKIFTALNGGFFKL